MYLAHVPLCLEEERTFRILSNERRGKSKSKEKTILARRRIFNISDTINCFKPFKRQSALFKLRIVFVCTSVLVGAWCIRLALSLKPLFIFVSWRDRRFLIFIFYIRSLSWWVVAERFSMVVGTISLSWWCCMPFAIVLSTTIEWI